MEFIKDLKTMRRVAEYLSAAQEQALYALVVEEIADDRVVSGLWAMALAKCDYDKLKAKAKYLELRVNMLREESLLSEEIALTLKAEETKKAEAKRVEERWERELQAKQAEAKRALERWEREVQAKQESVQRLKEFLEGSGYSLDIRGRGDKENYRVTAPRGASIGLQSLQQLKLFVDGLRAKAKEG